MFESDFPIPPPSWLKRLIALGAICLCLASAHAQSLNPRWHGVWEAGDKSTLRITDRTFAEIPDTPCKWRDAPVNKGDGCFAFYGGTITKSHLLSKQNHLAGNINQIEASEADSKRAGLELLRQNQKLLDIISNDRFRIVVIAVPANNEFYTGDSETYFFLDQDTIYSVTECEPCADQGFVITAYKKAGSQINIFATDSLAGTKGRDGTTKAPVPASAAASSAQTYKDISYADFLVDHDKMTGSRIRLKASIASFANIGIIRRNELDTNAIKADLSGLPREDRKKILTQCQHIACAGTFSAVVEKGYIGPSIKLEAIEWQGNILRR